MIDKIKLNLIRLTGILPLGIARCLGRLLGTLMSHTNSRNTRVTRINTRLCFTHLSDDEQQEHVKRSLQQTCILTLETCVVWARSPQWLLKHTTQKINEAAMHKAMQANKGVLILAPHLGNWEALGIDMTEYGKLTCMFQPPKQAFLGDFIYSKRQSYGIHLAPTSAKGVATCLKALKSGENVAILPDQNPMQGGGFAPFFGVQAHTITLIHGLVKRTGCRVIASFAKRVEHGFEIHFVEPHTDIYSQDEQTSLNGLNTTIETCVHACPDQYQWEYKRFKTQPNSTENRYK